MKSQAITPLIAFLVLFATAVAWRGIWGLFDLYWFPDNKPLSYSLSLILGLCLFLVLDVLKSRQK